MQALQQIIAQAWSDPAFKQQLIDNPATVLKQHGLDIPADKEIRVVEDDAQTAHLVIPEKPDDLDDSQLDQAAGGGNCYFCGAGGWLCE